METRRKFIQSLASAAAMAGAAGAPKFSFAQQGTKTFIKVFQRGGADGLHLFPLYGDPFYATYRPDLAILGPNGDGDRAISLGDAAAVDRDPVTGVRGMNPNLAPLMDIWDANNMMLAPCTSFAGANRSHFDCQRWIGTGDRDNLIDGYMNRFMQQVRPETQHPLRGLVAGKTSISTEIRGQVKVPAIRNGSDFSVSNSDLDNFDCGDGCDDFKMTSIMEEISSHDVDLSAAEGNIKENQLILLESIQDVAQSVATYNADDPKQYSDSDLGRGLRLCAQLIKNGVPLEVAALDWNIGWDTHSNQIDSDNQTNPFTDQTKRYNERMAQGARDFKLFWDDLGPVFRPNVVVLVGSEFGRTKKQNGSFGTDHGEGGAWFAFGGNTQKKVANDVTSIEDTPQVPSNRLPTLTSYRDIVGEIMVKHMGMPENVVSTVFPNHTFTDNLLFSSS